MSSGDGISKPEGHLTPLVSGGLKAAAHFNWNIFVDPIKQRPNQLWK